ncbi:MAG: FAD/NAD(P)-binding oxidoreductase [Thermodesulfobacteriota bacterium]
MKRIVILGAGTGGTMMANKLRRDLDPEEWKITIIDKDNTHYYQAGFLFLPFGINTGREITRSRRSLIPRGVDFVISEVTNIDWDAQRITTRTAGAFGYDVLIMSTGCRIMPEEIEGMAEGWQKNIFDYYTFEGATNLAKALKRFQGGKLVINIAEMPIKCPVAPLEFAFLADWYFQERGIRDQVEIELVTPLSGAFTKPVATRVLTEACQEKGIHITPNFSIGSVDADKKVITSYSGQEVDYDMLVAIPPNFGAQVMIDSGISDPMGYIPIDKQTCQPPGRPSVWAIGDGTNAPTSKAGSVAHYMADVIHENILAYIDGTAQHARFDGHAL